MKNIRLQTKKKKSKKINQSINQSIKNITNIYFHKNISIILLYLFYISTHLHSYIITMVWYTVHSSSDTFSYEISRNISINFHIIFNYFIF